MAARQENWVMVRVLRKTHEQLRAWQLMQDMNYARGTIGGLRGQADRIMSLDAAIAELLRRDDAHRRRARKAKKKRVYIADRKCIQETPHKDSVSNSSL